MTPVIIPLVRFTQWLLFVGRRDHAVNRGAPVQQAAQGRAIPCQQCISLRFVDSQPGDFVSPHVVTSNRRLATEHLQEPNRIQHTSPCLRVGNQLRTACNTRRSNGKASQRSEEHTSELQSLMRISYAVFCLKKKTHTT